jgi:hypothetical protein
VAARRFLSLRTVFGAGCCNERGKLGPATRAGNGRAQKERGRAAGEARLRDTRRGQGALSGDPQSPLRAADAAGVAPRHAGAAGGAAEQRRALFLRHGGGGAHQPRRRGAAFDHAGAHRHGRCGARAGGVDGREAAESAARDERVRAAAARSPAPCRAPAGCSAPGCSRAGCSAGASAGGVRGAAAARRAVAVAKGSSRARYIYTRAASASAGATRGPTARRLGRGLRIAPFAADPGGSAGGCRGAARGLEPASIGCRAEVR